MHRLHENTFNAEELYNLTFDRIFVNACSSSGNRRNKYEFMDGISIVYRLMIAICVHFLSFPMTGTILGWGEDMRIFHLGEKALMLCTVRLKNVLLNED
uniref:Uncharacterized protein n=1 Tax=Romanomermis culicivorax TaxID=13658 RepID=A0A915KE76_ROMCU